MSRKLSIIAIILLVTSISTNVFAHSNFSSSNPADGEVVTDTLNEIIVEFEGQIEQGSYMELSTAAGQSVELEELVIGEGTLTGTFANPLPNDNYQVKWSIISVDGHPVEGEFAFTVDMPLPEEPVEEEPEQLEEETASEIQEDEATEITNEPNENEANEPVATTQVEEEKTSSMNIIYIVILAILLAVALFLFARRKKK